MTNAPRETQGQKMRLISFEICPFVQRSAITLEEKQIPYDTEYVDLSNKPDWFIEISPFGKVPVLDVGGRYIFESAVINEYIDEVYEPKFHPTDPLQKAYHRAWVEFTSSLLGVQYRVYASPDESEARNAAAELNAGLKRIEEQIGNGPYFNGEALSLVDMAAAPLLQRIQWCEEIVPDLRILAGLPKVEAWSKAILARPSIEKSTVPNVKAIFHEYAKGRGSPTRNVESSWLGSQIGSQIG